MVGCARTTRGSGRCCAGWDRGAGPGGGLAGPAERAARGVSARRAGRTGGRPRSRSRWTRARAWSRAPSGRRGRRRRRAAAPRAAPPSWPTPTGRPAAGAATPTAQPEVVRAGRAAASGRSRTAPAARPRRWARPGRARRGRRWPRSTSSAPPTAAGSVAADDLRAPAGPRLRARRTATRRAPRVPELFAGGLRADPRDGAAAAARRPRRGGAAGVPGAAAVAVLTAGETDSAWFEHARPRRGAGRPAGPRGGRLAAADGGVEIAVGGERRPVDVLYRRFDDGMLGAYRTPIGQALDVLLTEAVRAGPAGAGQRAGQRRGRRRRDLRVGAGDDPASTWGRSRCWSRCRTWVLADPGSGRRCATGCTSSWSSRSPGYGGRGTVVGPTC